ncbi:hypothetical protein [uncultured Algibacter sp.]|uniref:hypothetical protein n=1 Tax=uncultured Algibacter sp. TaxID=298659 RepID=UPI00261A5F12|nr:hypothetical protein [uncultured Algibacter sp.]
MNNKKKHSNFRNNNRLKMKCLAVFLVLCCLLGCKAKNNLAEKTLNSVDKYWCPEDGVCSFEVLKERRLELKYDEFGMPYLNINNGNRTILKFEYKKTTSPNLADSNYREEVFIVLNTNNIEIETSNLKSEQIIFGRWCFCKGQAGNFKVSQGNLSIKKLNDTDYLLNLSFKVDEVPQIITEINHIFKWSS